MKPAVRTGALPGSTTACWPLVSRSMACSLPNRTLPSITDRVVRSVSSAATTNSVPSTPATAPRVMTRMRPGSSRWKNETMPRSKCSPHCASDESGGNTSTSVKAPKDTTLRSDQRSAIRLLAPVRNRSNGCSDLVGLRRHPGRGGGGRDLRRALKFHNPDFVRGHAAGRRLRPGHLDASQETQKNCGRQQAATGFKKQVQAFLSIRASDP